MLAYWQKTAIQQTFEPGEFICREGEPGEMLYIIESGSVTILKEADTENPVILGYRGDGALLGEISLISDEPRTASIMAMEQTTVRCVPFSEFWQELDNNREFRRVVMHSLIDLLMEADRSRIRSAAYEREMFQRVSSLSSEQERLGELLRLRRETMSFIVHDLRNPLNLVVVALSLIEDEPAFESGGDLEHLVQVAHEAVHRMIGLVDSLLEVEKLEQGGSLDRSWVSPIELLESVVAQNQPIAAMSEIDLRLNIAGDGLPDVWLDEHRVKRAITNLVDNAIKFTPRGGEVIISGSVEPDRLTITIEDSGPGIPEDARQRIFDRFSRTEDARRIKGFGLGLSYVHTVALAHGGDVTAEARLDGKNGARFVWWIPFQQAG